MTDICVPIVRSGPFLDAVDLSAICLPLATRRTARQIECTQFVNCSETCGPVCLSVRPVCAGTNAGSPFSLPRAKATSAFCGQMRQTDRCRGLPLCFQTLAPTASLSRKLSAASMKGQTRQISVPSSPAFLRWSGRRSKVGCNRCERIALSRLA